MTLDYALLISPTPLQLNLCSVRSPTLREIDALPDKFNTYHMYLSMLLLDIDTYYKNMELQGDSYFAGYTEKEKQQILSIRAEYAGLTEEQRALTGRLDIFGFDRKIVVPLTQALSFFLCEKIIYSPEENEFLIFGAESVDPVCTINSRQLSELESIILQLNAVSVNTMDAADAKNKTAAKIIEKLNKRKKAKEKSAKPDPKLELPNIISAISACHSSINILNIWDLTVYQVYDLFARMQQNTIFVVLKMSVAAWGNKDNKVDFTQWFECIKP